MALLAVKNLNFHIDEQPILREVSFSLEEGEFAVLTGPTGSGKSTLLRLIKKEIAPKGRKLGTIEVFGKRLSEISPEESLKIGYVMQRPENQIVTDKVYHELAFGLENLGLSREEIERKVGELASFFGIDSWFRKDTFALSGGEKQILALASVMAMDPRLLLLDEPTGELDPIASENFLSLLWKLNRELGVTVLLVEHRLDQVLEFADKLLVMEDGGITAQGRPEEVIFGLEDRGRIALPSAARIFLGLNGTGRLPLSVREGQEFLGKFRPEKEFREETAPSGEIALAAENLWFAYERRAEVLRGVDLKVREGEILCLVGGNGGGKTSLLKLLAGFHPPLQGRISVFGRSLKAYGKDYYKEIIAYLPQNPEDLFLEDAVEKEVEEEELSEFGLESLSRKHPYDLSGGEQQRLGLAKVLGKKARLLLLDEPTKALDLFWKDRLLAILKKRKEESTIIIATHDLDFAARIADRVGLVFDGRIQSLAGPRSFFGGNSFYTTAANRIARKVYPWALTEEEVVEAGRRNGEFDEVR